MPTVYLSLGSNIGDRVKNLGRALELLEDAVQIQRVSSVWETEPWGLSDQPWFLNIVCRGETDLSPHQLIGLIEKIERQLGRRRTIRYGPRTIDIDILLYNERIVRDPGLEIPHPRLAERAFVLFPLSEVAPDAIHPATGKSVDEMLAELDNAEVVRKLTDGPLRT
jgi:2-amino-4-hydroxy-6-hydroxymethyldihydropteridine diphosphokinase